MIVIDCEMSGISPEKNGILQIAAIDFENPSNFFFGECRLDDDAELYTREESGLVPITEFLQMSEEQMRDPSKQSLKELLGKFVEWLDSCDELTVMGQVAYMDLLFLKEAFFKHGFKYTLGHRTIDLHTLAYIYLKSHNLELPLKNKRTDLDLDYIAQLCGLPEEPTPHNALNGAKWEAECFSRILFGKQLLPDFEEFPIPEHLSKAF